MDDCQITDQKKNGRKPIDPTWELLDHARNRKKRGRGNGEAGPRVAAVRRGDLGRRSREPIRRNEHHRRLIGSRHPPITWRLPMMKGKRIHQFNHWLAGHMETGVTDRSLAIVFLLNTFPFTFTLHSSLVAAKNMSFLFYIW